MIKNYKLFLEKMITDANRLIAPKMDEFLERISLYHCGEHIYAVVAEKQTRGMLFLRPQEFYESGFDDIIGSQFRFSDYMDRYKKSLNREYFTYGADWSGYNIPSTVLEECMFNVPEDEINNYDKMMLSIIDTIKKLEGEHNYYLIGVEELKNTLLEHEFAHAMYFTLPEYKREMNVLREECDPKVKEMICKTIIDHGYANGVLPDELQAYLSTGLSKKMKELNLSGVDVEMKKYREVFERYYKENMFPNPKKMSVDWNVE